MVRIFIFALLLLAPFVARADTQPSICPLNQVYAGPASGAPGPLACRVLVPADLPIQTAPTISSGGCTSPAVTYSNGTAAFEVTIGTSCTGISTLVLTLPSATHGWACDANDITSNSTNAVSESANGVTSVTFTSYSRTAGTALAWNASDVVVGKCAAF